MRQHRPTPTHARRAHRGAPPLVWAMLLVAGLVTSACQATSAEDAVRVERSAADAAWTERLQGQADEMVAASARARADAAWTDRLNGQADASAAALSRGMAAYGARLQAAAAALAAAAAEPDAGD